MTEEGMTHHESIVIEQLTAENRYLRYQLDRTFDEALRLRHKLEHIYALSHLAIHPSSGDGTAEAAQDSEAPSL